MKWYKSLVFKIILCCIVLTFCLIGSIFGVFYHYQHSIVREMEEKSAEILRGIEVRLSNLEVEEASGDILESRLSDLNELRGVEAIILYDSQKNLVSGIQSNQLPVLEFGVPYRARVVDVHRPGGKKLLAYSRTFPLMVGSQEVGSVRIALAIAPQTHMVKALQSKMLIALMILFLGTIAALCYFMFKLLKPLHTMATTCQEISEGNLHEIDIKPNASEVLILEMKFNEMVEALKAKAKMEQRLAQSQRLAALGNLVAGVAHEIGNPLNGIKLTISHLKDMFSQHELDDSSFNRYVDTIAHEINRLDGIVKEFLTLAKERELSLVPCKVGRLLEDTVHLVEKEAQRKGLRINCDIPPVMTDALVDPQLLKGAILNILINAMEASAEAGSIDVRMAECDGRFIVTVADEGEGISSHIIERVFDPYFSTKSSGTGLGLSLTKTIIEKHGGEISLESQEGCGTTVTIGIPTGNE
jgi:signal transduction histidine kinase